MMSEDARIVYERRCQEIHCATNKHLLGVLSISEAALLTSLHLGDNYLGDKGALALIAALPLLPALTQLDLSSNGLANGAAVALGAAPLERVPLRSVELRANPLITREGGTALVQLTRNLRSLTYLGTEGTSITAPLAAAIRRQLESNVESISSVSAKADTKAVAMAQAEVGTGASPFLNLLRSTVPGSVMWPRRYSNAPQVATPGVVVTLSAPIPRTYTWCTVSTPSSPLVDEESPQPQGFDGSLRAANSISPATSPMYPMSGENHHVSFAQHLLQRAAHGNIDLDLDASLTSADYTHHTSFISSTPSTPFPHVRLLRNSAHDEEWELDDPAPRNRSTPEIDAPFRSASVGVPYAWPHRGGDETIVWSLTDSFRPEDLNTTGKGSLVIRTDRQHRRVVYSHAAQYMRDGLLPQVDEDVLATFELITAYVPRDIVIPTPKFRFPGVIDYIPSTPGPEACLRPNPPAGPLSKLGLELQSGAPATSPSSGWIGQPTPSFPPQLPPLQSPEDTEGRSLFSCFFPPRRAATPAALGAQSARPLSERLRAEVKRGVVGIHYLDDPALLSRSCEPGNPSFAPLSEYVAQKYRAGADHTAQATRLPPLGCSPGTSHRAGTGSAKISLAPLPAPSEPTERALEYNTAKKIHFAGVSMERYQRYSKWQQKFYLHKVIHHSRKGDKLTSGCLNRTGDRLLTGSYDMTCKVWDAETGEVRFVLQGHEGYVYDVAFNHPTCDRIVTTSFDRTCRVWDANDGQLLHVLEGHELEVVCAAVDPTGQVIASGGMDEVVILWEMTTGRRRATLEGHTAEVVGLDFSFDGRFLATGSSDETVRVWDVLTGQALHVLVRHRGEISCVRWHPRGTLILSASADGTACVWDAHSGAGKLLRGHAQEVVDADFSHNGWLIATASEDGSVRLWDTITAGCTGILVGHKAGVCRVAFSKHDTELLTGSADMTCKIWRVDTGECLQTLVGHHGVVLASFNAQSDVILTISKDNSCRLWKRDAVNKPLLEYVMLYVLQHQVLRLAVLMANGVPSAIRSRMVHIEARLNNMLSAPPTPCSPTRPRTTSVCNQERPDVLTLM
eukprot:TRINITY_DN32713_c0_g1_i1.p1 TRINITY_DN32713_c0_g1~~TRINITY_DN32713_c0_g1_i1.p1  ORF type:complete len:1075 (+),score=101.21 TRINITY_DN32713_c0_g1_i1:74-3298(+)